MNRQRRGKTAVIDYRLAREVLRIQDLARPDRDGKAACPECGRPDDRRPTLHIYDDHAYCFRCNKRFDAVDYLRATGAGDEQIAAMIGTPSWARRPASAPAPRSPGLPSAGTTSGVSVPEWQQVVDELVREGVESLWGRDGAEGRDYLRDRRGLTDHTMATFRLGWNPEDRWSRRLDCLPGKSSKPSGMFLPRGVMIPRPAAGGWASLTVRRLEGEPKYQEVRRPPDPSRGTDLFPRPVFPGGRVVLLVEGDFDALVGAQEAGHLVDCITAGSASRMRLTPAARRQLALAPFLLVATDSDAAGVAAARRWLRLYPHKSARVLLPYKDLSECFRAGVGVEGLVRSTLERVGQSHLLEGSGRRPSRFSCVAPGDDPYALLERAAIREEVGDPTFDPAAFAGEPTALPVVKTPRQTAPGTAGPPLLIVVTDAHLLSMDAME